ncbi:MAG: dihydroorotate dehydrogenase-like protein [Bacteroidales bacterium]|nr:dihydroorotate dehydrogenase-like protein [Bacteroidales bacterium]
MTDLSTEFAGLKLKNPIIAGSCGLTGSIEHIKEIEENGAGAIVLKSIFEEEITNEYEKILQEAQSDNRHEIDLDYFDYKIKQDNLDNYISLIKDAKDAVSIPVIASINCVSTHEWSFFAKKIEEAGADAVELNIFIAPTDTSKTSKEKEQIYFDIIGKITSSIQIPVIIKMSYYFTNLGSMIKRLSETNIKGLVLFNRFFSPDIDINSNKIIPVNIFSTPSELPTSLRWIAISSNNVSCDLAASTGVHNGEGVIKQILAGADAVQIVSAMYKNGIGVIKKMLTELENYMAEKNYDKLSYFQGLMSHKHTENPALYERVQFMRYFSARDIT